MRLRNLLWRNQKFGIAGSGMHCNMSLFDAEGNNASFDPNDPKGMQLSETHFLGGLITCLQLYCHQGTQLLTLQTFGSWL